MNSFRPRFAAVVGALIVVCVNTSALAQSASAPKAAIPLEPITAIIDAFKSYSVVTLGEGDHGNEQSHAFRQVLLRDPRFAATVNDIVVEFGNGMYQDLMDRYLRGDEVPHKELRKIWENTAVSGTLWDMPMYEEFYRAVRDLNAQLPKEHQLRVLLGDLPIDWDKIHNWADYSKISRNNVFPVEVIQREVLAKHRKALVIYGDGHYWRKNFFYPLKDEAMAEKRFATPNGSIVTRLERAGTPVFSIATNVYIELANMQPDIASWTPPKLALLRDTPLGRANSSTYYAGGDIWVMVDKEKGLEERTRADPARSPLMEDQFDAIIYLGPKSTMTRTKLPLSLCKDKEYVEMRSKRLESITSPGAEDFAAGFKKFCANAIAE